jgi:DNA-binding FrmR family transcriptional regulator
MLRYSNKTNEELTLYIEEEKALNSKRSEVSGQLTAIEKRVQELTHLDETITGIQAKKDELQLLQNTLLEERDTLLKENEYLYYKKILEYGMRVCKNKERDLLTNQMRVRTEIEKCTTALTSRSLLENRKEALEYALRQYELFYMVWNPRTGYPSMLIKEFLDEVAFITNTALDTIWGGLIRIESFIIDENEFRIPIIRGNSILADISECSTAEKSTLSLAISLSIIQASTSYNIVRIDEADGSFDDIRRQSFLTILNEHLYSTGCDDCYVITHNQFFESIPCNVILLKGYIDLVSPSALENKYILYQYPA